MATADPPSKNLVPADDDGAGPDVSQYYYWDGTRSVAIGRAEFVNMCENAAKFTQSSSYSVRITESKYLTVGGSGGSVSSGGPSFGGSVSSGGFGFGGSVSSGGFGFGGPARVCSSVDTQDIAHQQALCNSTTRVSLDKAAAAVEEKFRTTTSAPMPSLAECAQMTRAEAVALAGKLCRVPFTFVVAPTTVAPNDSPFEPY